MMIKIKNLTFNHNSNLDLKNNHITTIETNKNSGSSSSLSFNGYKRTKIQFLNKNTSTKNTERPMSADNYHKKKSSHKPYKDTIKKLHETAHFTPKNFVCSNSCSALESAKSHRRLYTNKRNIKDFKVIF